MKDNLLKYVLAILLGLVTSLIIFRIDFLQRSELFFYNLRFEFKKNNIIPDNIVLITIEPETVKSYKNQIVPYSKYAELISIISNSKVIGIDIPFIQFTDLNDIKELSDILSKQNNVILSSRFVGGFFQHFDNSITYVPPIPMLSQYAKYGYQNYVPDIDGFVRRTAFYYIFKSQSRIEESFSSLIAEKITGKSQKDNNRIYFINYLGKSGSFKNYSFKEIIEKPQQFKNTFSNKIVLIGAKSDVYKIPFVSNNEMSRVEIHANNILTILNEDFLNKANIQLNSFFILLMGFIGVLIAILFEKNKGIFIIGLIIIFYTLVNFIAFDIFETYFSLFTPILAIIISFLLTKYYIYNYRNKEIKRIKKIFKPYLPPQMIDEVIRKKDYVEVLRGERREVTVIFADIADFTILSDRLPTDEVVKILNEFLTHMTNVIFRNNGSLDKYTGDGVMAVFGNIGKTEIQENAHRAVKTAIEMNKELGELQQKWITSGQMPLQIRIGISTGEALVGNIGSPQHMDFTVIGDTVNIASRLEKLNKKFNTTILISKTTYEYVKEIVKVKTLETSAIRGKDEKVEVFELIGWKDS